MYEFISISWGVLSIVASIVAIAFYREYKKDLQWHRREYLWEYIDKKYDIVFVEKEGHDE